MQTKIFLTFGLSIIACLAGACGGDEEGIALLDGSGSGSFEGEAFEAIYGFAATNEEGRLTVAVGNGELNCSHVEGFPPEGTYVQVQLPAAVEGTPETHSVGFSRVTGNDFEFSSSTGSVDTVNVLSISDASVNIMVQFTSESLVFSGTFEVERCS